MYFSFYIDWRGENQSFASCDADVWPSHVFYTKITNRFYGLYHKRHVRDLGLLVLLAKYVYPLLLLIGFSFFLFFSYANLVLIMMRFTAFIDMPEMLYYMRSNYQYWKDLEEKGTISFSDICKMPLTTTLPKIPESSGTNWVNWS